MQYTIEKACPADLPAILEVMRFFNMHHVPSAEMPALDIDRFFVAKLDGKVVGAAGYTMLSPTEGKTTLLGVNPELSGLGIGKALQIARLEAMYELGAQTVLTNADIPDTIAWYKKHFGYLEIGRLKKIHSFGLEHVDHWTTIRMDLVRYMGERDAWEARREAHMQRYSPHPLSPWPPLIINVCPTGMIPTRASTPHVPLSVDEIVRDAIAVADAGAQMVHLHARDEATGRPTSDTRYFERILTGIRRERPELVCCVTTSGRNWPEFERRSEVLLLKGAAKPDMASLTLGSLNFLTGPSSNAIHTIERLAMCMRENDIKPELEIFDSGMINLARYLERHGILSGTKYFNLLLGNLNTAAATIGDLSHLVAALPEDSVWSAAGLGSFQLPMNVAAILAGGNVRVGLEDNIHYDAGRSRLATNVELVQRLVRISQEFERPLATCAQVRAMLGLRQQLETA
ncbi:MAG: GNAT family N-acetyltransferase [Chromatiales bacterium]|nr:GNAT family N-acetyltransferase [Chromatiales bacterium]